MRGGPGGARTQARIIVIHSRSEDVEHLGGLKGRLHPTT